MSCRVVLQIGIGFTWTMTVWSGMLLADSFPPIRLCPASTTAIYEPMPVRNEPIRNDVAFQTVQTFHTENWTWQSFPDGFIYPTYLAAVQNRLCGVANYDSKLGWMSDITLGGRAPLLRYGNKSVLYPEGWQLDLEGSVHLRMNMDEQMDMEANDFRFGLPISYGTKIWQVRTGYYHVSSHMGDRRMIRYYDMNHPGGGPGDPAGGPGDPAVPNTEYGMGTNIFSNYRIPYHREAWLLSYTFLPTPSTRLYVEADYAVMRGEYTKPWHFQFGAEFSPRYPARGGWGTPFAAVNVRLMQEHNFNGNVTVQTGWQWRGSHNQLLRFGVQYFSGVSDQYEFVVGPREHKIGLGVWYDF